MSFRSKFVRASLPFVFMAGIVASPAFAAGEWETVLDEDGVKGYSRSVDGSSLLEFRSTVVVPARIELVGEILRDVEGLKRGSSSCIEARIVNEKDRNNYTFYLAYAFPFPLDNRDVIVRVTTTYDFKMGRAISTLRAVTEPIVPHRKGFVRITDFTGEFILEYLGREKTGVVYTSRIDPGGMIPAFLVNHNNERALRSSADDMRAAIKEPKYIQAAARSADTELVDRVSGNRAMMAEIVKNRLAVYIRDREVLDRLMGDERVMRSLIEGEGRVGEILLYGWGSHDSKRRAVTELMRQLLAGHTRDNAAIARVAEDRVLVDRILSGRGGAASILDKAIADFDKRGR